MKCLVPLLMIPLMLACRPTMQSSQVSNVFEGDDRIPLSPADAAWGKVGKVWIGKSKSGWCTGTLVAPDLVLTNGHCVYLDDSDRRNPNLVFEPYLGPTGPYIVSEAKELWFGSLYKGSFGQQDETGPNSDMDSAIVEASRDKNPPPRIRDWMIFRIPTPLGKELGYFKIQTLPPETLLASTVTQVGFSHDFKDQNQPAMHKDCRIRSYDERPQLLLHDCDSTRGASGAPLLWEQGSETSIVGVSTSERRDGLADSLDSISYEDSRANIAIGTKFIVEGLAKAQETFATLPKHTSFQFCNATSQDYLELTFAVPTAKRGWISKGWILMKRDQCQEIVVDAQQQYAGPIYFYARHAEENIGTIGARRFCIIPDKPFTEQDPLDNACPAGTSEQLFAESHPIAYGSMNIISLKDRAQD